MPQASKRRMQQETHANKKRDQKNIARGFKYPSDEKTADVELPVSPPLASNKHPLEHPLRVGVFNTKWDEYAGTNPGIAAGGIAAIAAKYYRADGVDCSCACAKCTAVIESGGAVALTQITTSKWNKMKVVEKDGFIVSHGYDRGLSKPDRERAGGELVKKGAFIHPPSAAPPSVVAAAEPPTPSPAACSRSSWGSRTVEEELTSATRISPRKLRISPPTLS